MTKLAAVNVATMSREQYIGCQKSRGARRPTSRLREQFLGRGVVLVYY
jgi:hypothetical protein